LTDLLTRLNEIRREHPALQQLRNLTVHDSTDGEILCFSKRVAPEHAADGVGETVIVCVTTDPYTTRQGHLSLDMGALGLADHEEFVAHDVLSGQTFRWDAHPFVRLDPHGGCAHIIVVEHR